MSPLADLSFSGKEQDSLVKLKSACWPNQTVCTWSSFLLQALAAEAYIYFCPLSRQRGPLRGLHGIPGEFLIWTSVGDANFRMDNADMGDCGGHKWDCPGEDRPKDLARVQDCCPSLEVSAARFLRLEFRMDCRGATAGVADLPPKIRASTSDTNSQLLICFVCPHGQQMRTH